MQHMGTQGTLPTQLGRLTRLKFIQAADSNITGVLPTQLGTLRSLNHLQLQRNHISGTSRRSTSGPSATAAANRPPDLRPRRLC